MSQNMQGFPDAQALLQQQHQQQQPEQHTQQEQAQTLNNGDLNPTLTSGAMQQQQNSSQMQMPGLGNSGISPAMLLPNQPFAALLQPGGGVNANGSTGNDTSNSNSINQGGLDVNSELKRLQQLQQQMNPQGQNNALLLPNANNNSNNQMNAGMQNNQAALLQQMLEQQKLQNNGNFMGGTGGFNPLFGQPGLLQDARLLLAQSQFGGLMPGQPNAAPEVPLPSPHSLFHRDGSRRMRGGVIEPFPEKLHRLLVEVEAAGRSDVISFVANGRAFAIHKPDKFFKEIVPLYFRQSRLSSFKRQLNLYGFELINTGPSRGGYFHELFVKDRPEICRRMRRVAVKVSSGGNKQEGEGGDSSKVNMAGPSSAAGMSGVNPNMQQAGGATGNQLDPRQGNGNGPLV
eukprot:CAMPEP_0172449198 /NCGR_PEP_ID=MMETSP1065-20121228/7959_1 /TAXON_ID=265537 /ORGANISM="Amphiprora paludosa, Strain CCMP125" /LENGTH=400 /DNA_ID=CAMNT_0013200815 /DNA_START=215 /DNA_END=1417 /DNA_ORIENTATION=-